MNIVILICVFLTPLIVGFISIRVSIVKGNENNQYINNFHEIFLNYVKSNGKDYESYATLVMQSLKVQDLLGHLGIIYSYQPKYSNHFFPEMQIITNFIPQINANFNNSRSYNDGEELNFLINSVRESLLRYHGFLIKRDDELKTLIKNPFRLYAFGVKEICYLPVSLLLSFGIISLGSSDKIFNSWFFSLITFLVWLLGLIGTIITILTGWAPFINYLKLHNLI